MFHYNNFFDLGPFLTFHSNVMDQKMAGAKKVVKTKYQFFHAHQPCIEIFEIHSLMSWFFMTSFPKLLMAAAIPGVEIFC